MSAQTGRPVRRSLDEGGGAGDGQGLEENSGEDRGMTGWETKTLGEVAQIERGKFSHRPRNEPRFYGGNTPFVQTGDVTRSNGLVRTHTQTLNEDGVAISKVFPAGTILITIAANIGYAGILEFDSAAPDSLIGLTPDDTVSAEFLNFYLRTQQPEMDRMAPKGTQKNINIQFLKPWPVVVPPLPEQKKIAHILSTLQRAIEAQERIIQTTTELKKALMHMLFTEGLRNEPQKQTEIGPVPESWEVVPLGKYARVLNGYAFKSADYVADGGLQQTEVDELFRLNQRCHDVVEAHDPASAKDDPPPTPDELKQDIADLRALVDAVKARRKAAKSGGS